VHLVGFIIRIYHDAQSTERQTLHIVKVLNSTNIFTPEKTAAKTREG